MRLLLLAVAVFGVLGVSLAFGGSSVQESAPPCRFGRVQGFMSIRADPAYLVGTIPSRFTGQARYFSRRYNCKGYDVHIRRVDTGIYDVQFVGLGFRLALTTAISQEGVAASVQPLPDSTYRVALRGPLVNDNGTLLERRDIPFSLAIF